MPPRTNIPFAGYGDAAVAFITEVNHAWGQLGAGTVDFWSAWNAMVFRDSGAGGVQLQSLDGVYDLLAVDGMTDNYKADGEKWDLVENAGVIIAGPIRAMRNDGPQVKLPLNPDFDPLGRIKQAVQQKFSEWVDLLPLRTIIRLLVNGRISPKHQLALAYDKLPLFDHAHLTNPTSSLVKPATFDNWVVLPGAVDESAVTKIFDQLYRMPDVDGVQLPNATGKLRPLIMCPSKGVANRWAHILGGPNAPRDLFQQGVNAGISSVNVGEADIMVNPYLVTLVEPSRPLGFDPEKRSYVWSRRGRKPLIYRETQAPIIKNTGPMGAPAHEMDSDVIYVRGRNGAGIGDPRGVLAVDEK